MRMDMLYFARWKIALILLACAAAFVVALPNFLSKEMRAAMPAFMPRHTVNLGLDLQGGSYLLLEVDFAAYLRDQLANLTDGVRNQLRARKIGYANLGITPDNKVHFSLREDTQEDMVALLRGIDPDLDINVQGKEIFVAFTDKWFSARKKLVLEQSLEIVSRRVNETGTREPIIERQGDSRILLQVPGLANPEHLKELLGQTAKMTFHLLNENVGSQEIANGNMPPDTRLLLEDTHGQPNLSPRSYPIFSRVILSGDMLVDAHATFDPQNNEPVVAFRFNAAGASKFAEVTAANVGHPFAIVLDDKVITAPVIRQPIIGGNGIISGSFTPQSANDLALLLRAGALPAPLKVAEERSVGPSLGSDSITAGAHASLIAVGFVILFMIGIYGLFGFFATLAMLVNALIVLALMSLLEATLTLPGIAGIVLTMGMAVDTNVLIYERMREELRAGKGVHAAIENGFRMAFGTIIDSHITTLSAAMLLYYFGSGTVKGFGITLSIGILASLFTAVLVTRLMIVTWLRKTKPKALPI